MRLKPLFLTLLSVSLALALLPAIWPRLDILVAGYFLQDKPPIDPSRWLWVDWVNEYTPDTFRTLALVCLAAWIAISLSPKLRHSGMRLGFVGLSLLLGPGFATWAVKEHHLRARPFDVVEFGGDRLFTGALVQANQCIDNCAFVSGHVACGFFFVSLMLIDEKHRGLWAAVGLVAGLTIGVARMSVGAHWLSDVLWALPLTLSVSGLVWWILQKVYRTGPNPILTQP